MAQINVVHVLNSLDKINFGVWNAALFTAKYLKEKENVASFVIVTQKKEEIAVEFEFPVYILKGDKKKEIISFCEFHSLSTANTIVVTHGCWQRPTQIGHQFKQLGFAWIYTPQGMLEPWSLKQKKIKKKIYFSLFEKRWSSKADCVRAVSETEFENLKKLYKQQVHLIGNGIIVPDYQRKPEGNENWLFMARLHHKKGLVPLVRAWSNVMRDVENKKMIIAGPDEGELMKVKPYINGKNIEYVGPVYGQAKDALLRITHYYILPSFSEGFPTSVVEAMGYGAIPLISKGCNFQEVFSNGLGYEIEPSEESISTQLSLLRDNQYDHNLSKSNHEFIKRYYSDHVIGRKLFDLYQRLILSN